MKTKHQEAILYSVLLLAYIGSRYCGWLNFRGVPIFVVFVEGPVHEFQCQRKSHFLYELWRKILWLTNFEPRQCLIFLQSTKIGTHKNKAIHSIIRIKYRRTRVLSVSLPSVCKNCSFNPTFVSSPGQMSGELLSYPRRRRQRRRARAQKL